MTLQFWVTLCSSVCYICSVNVCVFSCLYTALALVFIYFKMHIWCSTFWTCTAHTWSVFLKDPGVFYFSSWHHLSHTYKNVSYFICIQSIALEWNLGKAVYLLHNLSQFSYWNIYTKLFLLGVVKHFLFLVCYSTKLKVNRGQCIFLTGCLLSKLEEDSEVVVFVLPAKNQLPLHSFCISGVCLWKG
jgi:hypothetical protein